MHGLKRYSRSDVEKVRDEVDGNGPAGTSFKISLDRARVNRDRHSFSFTTPSLNAPFTIFDDVAKIAQNPDLQHLSGLGRTLIHPV